MKKTVLLLLASSCFLAAGANAQTDASLATAGIFNYYAVLLGANELTPTTPAGDPTAVGFARVIVDTTANTVTFTILDSDLPNTTIIASHIHEKGAGLQGDVEIPFNQPFSTGGVSSGTVPADPAVLARLVANPSGFYVNVHTRTFPAGASRGQLFTAPGTAIGSCLPDLTTLCLNQGRFKVQVAFQISTIPAGVGNAIPLTGDTGSFWFFSQNNIEMTIKVVDGRAVNGKFWFFAGALSDVAYTITVTDLTSGAVKTYTAARGIQTALNDTSAF